MKLKFRAEAKDVVLFIVFCIALFYLCCIAIVNLSSLASDGQFTGLNPITALTEHAFATFVVFIFILAAIIMSVSSLFFDREKGVGFRMGSKNENGYARLTTDKEMKKELKMVLANDITSEYAGIPIINDGNRIWVDDGEYHSLIIGSTGSGKTEMTIQPMVKILAKKGESMIITDPKGEIYEKNATELREKGYNIVLLNFRNPQNGNCWNPLTLPLEFYNSGNKDKATELLEDLAVNILYDEAAKGQDPFWEKTSADYFSGLTLALFEDAKKEEINLNSINLMSTDGEDKLGNSTYIKEYFNEKDHASSAYINVSSTIMAPSDTKASILSVFKQKIRLFSSRENLSEMLAHSDFDMFEIGRKKTAVFLVIQDEKKTYHSLVTIFLKQCYETLISVAQDTGGKLPYRTNFILDEFANMPPLKDVTTMITAARSRRIRFSLVIQNFAQLYEVYGKENGETIKGNCGNIIYLISSELASLEEVSKLAGEVKSKEKDKTDSRPLLTVSDLQRLPMWSIVCIRSRMMPYKTKMVPNWQMEQNNAWGPSYPKADYPLREKQPVPTFDVKTYVNKHKEEKVSQMLNGMGGKQAGTMAMPPYGMEMPSMGLPPRRTPNKAPAPFDIDDMVKRIDAKIAELEAEEKAEREALEAKQSEVKPLEQPKVIEESLPTAEVKVEQPVVREAREQVAETKQEQPKEEATKPLETQTPVAPKEVEVQVAPPMVEEQKTTETPPLAEVKKVVEEQVAIPPAKETKKAEPKKATPTQEATEEKYADDYISDDQFFDDFFSDEE